MAGKGNGGNWWLPPGLDESACIAAYQFKRAESASASLINLVNPEKYNLNVNNNPEWDEDKGYFLKGTGFLNATDIKNEEQIGTMIVRYELPSTDNDELIQMTNIRLSGKYDSFYHFVFAARFQLSYMKNGSQQYATSQYPGIAYQYIGTNPNDSDYQVLKYALGNTVAPQTGVLGASVWLNSTNNKKTCGLWLNGELITGEFKSENNVTSIINSGMGNVNNQTLSPSATGHYVIAAAYYKPNLSTAFHNAIAEMMLEI